VRIHHAASGFREPQVAGKGVGAQARNLEVFLAQVADMEPLLRPAAFGFFALRRVELGCFADLQLDLLCHGSPSGWFRDNRVKAREATDRVLLS
jgi:hypothetical protein